MKTMKILLIHTNGTSIDVDMSYKTLDNGWGNFLFMLEYKQKFRGHLLVKINKWFPSFQLCHCCHAKNPLVKNLKIRTWTCSNCSAVHDRDVNAAINILDEGLRLVSAGLLA